MAWQQNSACPADLPFPGTPMTDPLNIAIVDDESEFTELLAMVLNSSGKFRVVATGSNGWEALHVAEHLQIDALLIDLALPGLNGMMVLERLRETAPGMPVVIMSGFPVLDVYARGAKGYLEKRGDLSDFPSKLFNLLASAT